MSRATETTFELRPFGRFDRELDFELIYRFADCQVPQDPAGNQEWLQNRRQYDETKGSRRHYIATHSTTKESVGYAAIEQQGPDPTVFRLYIVFDPKQWTFSDVGEFLYQHLRQDANELGAKKLIMVEYETDTPFAQFLHEHGFIAAGTLTYNGFEVVRFIKEL